LVQTIAALRPTHDLLPATRMELYLRTINFIMTLDYRTVNIEEPHLQSPLSLYNVKVVSYETFINQRQR
jgi:hypothetical protein